MGKPTKVKFQGQIIDGEELGFQPIKETWNEYKAEDGATIIMKTVVTKIIKAKDRYTETGDPLYIVLSSNIVEAKEVPEEYKKM